jgi:proteasome lid subunit RPN8/RPN11
MMEAAVVVGLDGSPLHWHSPPDRTSVAIPDSAAFWNVLWEHRDNLAGVAHSHPGSGLPTPSHEDETTFSAIEAALGRRLSWWITSTDRVIVLRWKGPAPLLYRGREVDPASEPCIWLEGLRTLSSYDLQANP